MKKKQFILSGLFSLLLIMPFSSVEAIGMTPPFIEVQSILRNTVQYKTVHIVRAEGEDGDLTIQIKPREDSVDYFDIESPQIIMPAGVSTMEYELAIAPGDTPNGTYKGKVDFLKIPKSLSGDPEDGTVGSGMVVVTGVTIPVTFTVSGEELIEYDIANFTVADSEIDQSLFVNYIVSNTGNVNWRPDYIDFTFSDVDNIKNVVTQRVEGEILQSVQPGKQGEKVQIELAHTLEAGTYNVQANVVSGEETTTLTATELNIYPAGTLAQEGELLTLSTNKSEYDLGEKIKVDAVFANTGQVPVKTILITEVYNGDELIDILRGQELLVEAGRQSTLSEVIELNDPGTYTITSYVEYGFKRTEQDEVLVRVVGGFFASTTNSFLLLLALSILILGGAVAYRGYKIGKKG